MATVSHTLSSVADRWPVGTVVSAYLPGSIPGQLTSGAALTTATVQSNGSLTFAGLAESTRHVATDGSKSLTFTTAAAPAVAAVTVKLGPCCTLDPRHAGNAAVASQAASRGYYMRVRHGKVGSTGARIVVGTASGNIVVAAYANNGQEGDAAAPAGAPICTTGTIACPAAGEQLVTWTAPTTIPDGAWLFIAADNVTATFTGVSTFPGTSGNSVPGMVCFQNAAIPAPTGGTLTNATRAFWIKAE